MIVFRNVLGHLFELDISMFEFISVNIELVFLGAEFFLAQMV